MQIRPTAFSIGLIICSFIPLFLVYTEFGIDSLPLPKNAVNSPFTAFVIYERLFISNTFLTLGYFVRPVRNCQKFCAGLILFADCKQLCHFCRRALLAGVVQMSINVGCYLEC